MKCLYGKPVTSQRAPDERLLGAATAPVGQIRGSAGADVESEGG
jgi:hypothetical protein